MEMKDFNNSKIIKVNCSFCGEDMECPEEMLEKWKKHMCYKCFITNGLSRDDLKEVHVDIPTEKMPEVVASGMADRMVEDLFPSLWSEKKNELKEMSKKDIAEQMFGIGAFWGVRAFMEHTGEVEEQKNNEKESN